MKLTELQITELKNLNDSRVNQILGFGLEVGKWYKFPSLGYGKLMFLFNGNYGNQVTYGFSSSGKWLNTIGVHKCDYYVEATHEEVEQALIEEAERRGFKKGVKVKTLIYEPNVVELSSNNFDWDFINKEYHLRDSEGESIFHNGVWAEIIDEKAELKQEIEDLENKLKELREKL